MQIEIGPQPGWGQTGQTNPATKVSCIILDFQKKCYVDLFAAAYLGYGRHGTYHGHHFDGGHKNSLSKIKIFMHSFLNLYFAPHPREVTRLDGARDNKQDGAPIFEPEVFRKQMYCIEESTFGIVGSFLRPIK